MGAGTTSRRRTPRLDCFIEATLDLADREIACIVTNISDRGAGAWCAEPDRLSVDAVASLQLPRRDPVAVTVRHVTDDFVGVAFA